VQGDGHWVRVQVNASLVRNSAGQPLHVISQTQDITERRQAEEEIRKLNAELCARRCTASRASPDSCGRTWAP